MEELVISIQSAWPSKKRWQSKKLQMQSAQNLPSERTWVVRRSDEGEAQRRRWTFCEAINMGSENFPFPVFRTPESATQAGSALDP
jgi:hypothetical protein